MKSHLFCIALTAALLLTAGCQNQNSGSAQSSQDAQSQKDEVIAQVGDQNIMYSQLAEHMVTLEAMYSGLSDQFTTQELQEKLHTAAMESLENLITQQILYCKIDEYGITLTPEEETEAQKAWEETLESTRSSVESTYPELEGEDLEAMVQTAIETAGLKEEEVVSNARQTALVNKLKEQVIAQAERPTQQEIEDAYEQLLSEQQEEFSNDSMAFEASMLAGKPVVFVPESYRVIQELYLQFDSEVTQLLREMKSYDTDESDSYEEILELEYEKLQQGDVAQAQKRLANGEDFAQLMEENKPGSGSTYNYVGEGTTRLSENYYQAAMSIPELGQVTSQPVKMDYGYALLYWADTLAPGVRPLEDVQEALESQLYEAEQNELWKETQARWREETEVVIFEDRLGY
ncbi:hypothetical protein DWX58_13450 [Pseudoflavonifractor sp. AF19-9AC]|nr:hypothetical protein DWX58_13450 [Pseudoflavonifractor sp. AF19-9AC]